MFKLYKNFKLRDWIGVILIIGFTFLQVYFTMSIIDFMQDLIQSITYINYHNNPSQLGALNDMINMLGGFNNINESTLANLGLDESVKNMLINIANAKVGDIWYNGLMMILIAFFIMIVQGIVSVVASYVAADLSTSIRSKLYNKVENLSLGEINNFSTSSLITRTTNDIQQVQMANLMMMRMIFAAPITAIWAIIKIKASSTELTIATAVAIIALVVFIGTIMVVVLPKFKSMQKLTDKINLVTRENLTGIRIIRAFNAESYQEERFNKANSNLTKAQLFTSRIMALMSPVMMIIMNGISLAIYWIGATLINKGTISYATVSAFMMLSSQIIMSFVMLMMMFVLWPRASVSAQRINEVLDSKTSIEDPIKEENLKEEGTIEFKNVSFAYNDGESDTISDISFKVNKGETLAIIGATGSGKTTLINLIPRLYDVKEGEVLIDGVNVKQISQSKLRHIVSYVPQRGFLFKGTIKENVSLANPSLSLEEVQKACSIAEANDFINAKEEKYDYEISQGGKNVSGGQKQRLCIARAISVRPEILIFDDSFSALDYKTDKKVRENLNNLDYKVTKIIVAQRIGTIMDADQIIVLEDGKIVGKGRHGDLLKNCSTYREIALSQLSKEELGL